MLALGVGGVGGWQAREALLASVDLRVRLRKPVQAAGAAGLAAAALVARGDVAQDLAAAQRPTRGGGQVELAVAPEDSLAPRPPGGAGGMAADAPVLAARAAPCMLPGMPFRQPLPEKEAHETLAVLLR